jgi:hypothetical protein
MLQKPEQVSGKCHARFAQLREQALALGAFYRVVRCTRGSGLGWYFLGNSGDNIASYRTQPVVKGDLEKTVTALAQVRPKTFVDVGTQVSGNCARSKSRSATRSSRANCSHRSIPRFTRPVCLPTAQK